jgi:hypothetical protein
VLVGLGFSTFQGIRSQKESTPVNVVPVRPIAPKAQYEKDKKKLAFALVL